MVSWENARRLIALGLLVLGFLTLHSQGQKIAHTQEHGATQQAELRATQKALSSTQALLLRSNKESTETRITTVTQRCNFTKLVIDELVLRAPRLDSAKFEQSYRGCEKQLAKVKEINARTPVAPR
jgi:hypothetical protein